MHIFNIHVFSACGHEFALHWFYNKCMCHHSRHVGPQTRDHLPLEHPDEAEDQSVGRSSCDMSRDVHWNLFYTWNANVSGYIISTTKIHKRDDKKGFLGYYMLPVGGSPHKG